MGQLCSLVRGAAFPRPHEASLDGDGAPEVPPHLRDLCLDVTWIRSWYLLTDSLSLASLPPSAFRCGLQFLGNVASRNADSQAVVWTHAFPELFL